MISERARQLKAFFPKENLARGELTMSEHLDKIFTYKVNNNKSGNLPTVTATNYYDRALDSTDVTGRLLATMNNKIKAANVDSFNVAELIKLTGYQGNLDEEKQRDLPVLAAIVQAAENGHSIQAILTQMATSYFHSLDRTHIELFRKAVAEIKDSIAFFFAPDDYDPEDDAFLKRYVIEHVVYIFGNVIQRASKSWYTSPVSSYSEKAEQLYIANNAWLESITP